MREYGKVFSRIWESATFRALSEDGRTLTMYLLTCQHGTIAGLFRMPDGYACEDLQWSPERVQEGFAELFRKGFANRCGTTKWVWITKYLEWNAPENPNQRKAIAKIAQSVPDGCSWKRDFMRVWAEVLALPSPPKENPSETVPEPFLNQEQEQEQEKEEQPSPRARGDEVVPPGFSAVWASWPKSDRKGGKAECLKLWRRAGLEAEAEAIRTHVEAMSRTEGWRKEGGQFIPAPLVYLRQRRWDGSDLTASNDEPAGRSPLMAGAI